MCNFSRRSNFGFCEFQSWFHRVVMEKQQFCAYLFGLPLPKLKEILAQGHHHEKNLEELHRKSLLAACPSHFPRQTNTATNSATQKASIVETGVQVSDDFEMATSDDDVPQSQAPKKRKFVSFASEPSSLSAEDKHTFGGYLWPPLIALDEAFLPDWVALRQAHAGGRLHSFRDFPAVVWQLQLASKNWRFIEGACPYTIYTRNPAFCVCELDFFQEGVDYFVGAAALMTFVCAQACLIGDSALVQDAMRLLDPPPHRHTAAHAGSSDVPVSARSAKPPKASHMEGTFSLGESPQDANSPPYSPIAETDSDDEL